MYDIRAIVKTKFVITATTEPMLNNKFRSISAFTFVMVCVS